MTENIPDTKSTMDFLAIVVVVSRADAGIYTSMPMEILSPAPLFIILIRISERRRCWRRCAHRCLWATVKANPSMITYSGLALCWIILAH